MRNEVTINGNEVAAIAIMAIARGGMKVAADTIDDVIISMATGHADNGEMAESLALVIEALNRAVSQVTNAAEHAGIDLYTGAGPDE